MTSFRQFNLLDGHPVWRFLGVVTGVMALGIGYFVYRVLYVQNSGYLGIIFLFAAIFSAVLWVWLVLSCLFWHFIGRLLPAGDHRSRWIFSICFFLAPFVVYFLKYGAIYLYYYFLSLD